METFLNQSKNPVRDSYIWNMAGSFLLAFQSVIILMVLTRICDLSEAGIFTIAYANANLFFTIGKNGMRYFQASDPKERYTFKDYLMSRVVTTVLMLLLVAVYVLWVSGANGYTVRKMSIIFLMCVFKSVDVVEDIFFGRYQQMGRLDIAAKAITLRVSFSTVVFLVMLVISKDLLGTLMVSILLSYVMLFYVLKITIEPFKGERNPADWHQVKRLLIDCFPLFFGAFLSIYISNAPKYAIDALLSDELQACYGFISMPVLVISLLNGIIFNPVIREMSILWNESKILDFCKRVIRQLFIVLGLTGVCVAGAWLIGIPVLSVLYNTDLSDYKMELIILLLGGGLLGISGLFSTVITIIRYQKSLLVGYTVVSVLAFLLSDKIVAEYEIFGASVLYLLLMLVLSICFALFLIVGIVRKRVELK